MIGFWHFFCGPIIPNAFQNTFFIKISIEGGWGCMSVPAFAKLCESATKRGDLLNGDGNEFGVFSGVDSVKALLAAAIVFSLAAAFSLLILFSSFLASERGSSERQRC